MVMITKITLDELRRMRNTEGLILQGCGGEPQVWLNGINKILTAQGILLDSDTFKKASVFEHEGHTNILLHMDNVKLDVGKLALWRLQSHSTFGGDWLSDYLPNKFGIEIDAPPPAEHQKPEAPIIGADGNVFNILGIASRALKQNGMAEAAKEMRARVMDGGSYDETLAIIMEYVEPVQAEGYSQGYMEMRM